MEQKIEEFKRFHKIETEIDLPFKIENDQLFAFYHDQWIQLSQEKNPKKFYRFASLKRKYSVLLCRELGIKIPGYSREMYEKYKDSYIKASKKYNQKAYQDPVRYEKHKKNCRDAARKSQQKKKQKNLRN